MGKGSRTPEENVSSTIILISIRLINLEVIPAAQCPQNTYRNNSAILSLCVNLSGIDEL